MKRQLNIAYREKIESGEYKVTTREGRKARIVCWDVKDDVYPIVALIASLDGSESVETFTENGEFYRRSNENLDLFVEVPDERIPFDMKYRDDITLGRVKVQTERGEDVRIISFDGTKEYPVVGVVSGGAGEYVESWTTAGVYCPPRGKTKDDLVIVKEDAK